MGERCVAPDSPHEKWYYPQGVSNIVDKIRFANYNVLCKGKYMTEKNEFDINNANDAGFRAYFSEKEVAMSFFKLKLPPEINKYLDYRTLKICKDTFIDEQLKDRRSDMLYEIKYKKSTMLLYLLFEHKSYRDPWVALQILKYMLRIWELYLSQHKGAKKLPVVLPLMIYHGESKWNIDTNFNALFDAPAELDNFIPNFNYQPFDISHMPDQEMGAALLRIILMTFKYINSPELLQRLKDIFALFDELENKTKRTEYLEILLRYLGSCGDHISFDDIEEALSPSIKDGGTIMATIAQQFIQKGRLQGKQEGREEKENDLVKNSLKLGLPLETIAQITNCTVDKVKEMIARFDMQNTAKA